MPRIPELISRIVAAAARRAPVVVASLVLLGLAAAGYVGAHFSVHTEAAALIPADAPWRRQEARLERAFVHERDDITVVIDGATPELAEAAAARLSAALVTRPDMFDLVERPGAGPYFDQEGVLFLSAAEVQRAMDGLIQAQPLLGPLASDPSLRGVMTSLGAAADGLVANGASAGALQGPVEALGEAAAAALRGRTRYISWRGVMSGEAASPADRRQILILVPKLDESRGEPGAAAVELVRAVTQKLALDEAHGVRVRLTGEIPMAVDELKTLGEATGAIALASLIVVLGVLYLAVGSWRAVLAALLTVAVGLSLTAALALAVFGRFNLLSVAFFPLFVGLGVDFAIQFCVRHRAEAGEEPKRSLALAKAGAGVGQGLALAAAAMTLGFFAFLPTHYKGLAELGAIAGIGMVVALLLSITFLPAALLLLRPASPARDTGLAALRHADAAVVRRRGAILATAVLAALAGAALSLRLDINFDPLRLRSPASESLATYREIARDPSFGAEALDLMTPDIAKARVLAGRLRRLPQADEVLNAESLIPPDQGPKLAIVQDAANILDPTVNPFDLATPPSDAEQVRAMLDASRSLRALASQPGPGAEAARNLADLLERIAAGPPALRARLQDAATAGLPTALQQVRALLTAHEVSLATLPAEVKRDWIAPDGQARVQVTPAARYADPARLPDFVRAVSRVAPGAVGPSVARIEVQRLILGAFAQAALLALAAIVALLLVTLRRWSDVALTLAPVLLSGMLTAATCVLLGQDINLENLIALPLLLGVGVSFSIYFVVAWRGGARRLLASSLARAILFSAATTGAAFGALALSQHPGTASLGILLLISLFWTLVATLVVLPALLSVVRPASAPSAR